MGVASWTHARCPLDSLPALTPTRTDVELVTVTVRADRVSKNDGGILPIDIRHSVLLLRDLTSSYVAVCRAAGARTNAIGYPELRDVRVGSIEIAIALPTAFVGVVGALRAYVKFWEDCLNVKGRIELESEQIRTALMEERLSQARIGRELERIAPDEDARNWRFRGGEITVSDEEW